MTWTPVTPRHRGQTLQAPTDSVKVLRDGSIVVSPDLLARMGAEDRVTLLTNDNPTKLGVRAFRDSATEQAYRLGRHSSARSGRRIHAGTVLWHLNRRALTAIELPHAWDGDVLVIDLSSLPKREEG